MAKKSIILVLLMTCISIHAAPPRERGKKRSPVKREAVEKRSSETKKSTFEKKVPEAAEAKVVESGEAIIEQGVFDKGCFYGINESISDHAPVIYKNLGTWNVTLPINHVSVGAKGKAHVNHTFIINEDQIVVDRSGKAGDLGGDSEKIALKKIYTPEKVKQMIEIRKDDEVVRDTKPLLQKLEEARIKAIAMVKKSEASPQELKEWSNAVNELKRDADKEVGNEDEEKFTNTRELLRLLEESNAFINNKYVDRMTAVAAKIRDFFKRYPDLQYFVIQEVPNYSEKTLAGEPVGALLKEAFEPSDPWVEAVKRVLDKATTDDAGILHLDTDKLETIFAEAPERVPNGNTKALVRELVRLKKSELEKLTRADDLQAQNKVTTQTMADLKNLLKSGEEGIRINFAQNPRTKAQTAISKTNYRKNNALDVALVSRASAPILHQVNPPDADNRLVPWCSDITKECFVSSHLPMPIPDEELKLRCQDIRSMALSLMKKGYKKISFAGDFNVDAERVLRICQNDDLNLPKGTSGSFSIHSTEGLQGSSCGGGNKGRIVPKNIDIKIEYLFN